MGNYINGAQWDVCLHALCVGSGTTSPGVRDGLISFVTSRRSARKRQTSCLYWVWDKDRPAVYTGSGIKTDQLSILGLG